MISSMRRRRQLNRNLRKLRTMILHSPTQSVRDDLLAIAARTNPGNR